MSLAIDPTVRDLPNDRNTVGGEKACKALIAQR